MDIQISNLPDLSETLFQRFLGVVLYTAHFASEASGSVASGLFDFLVREMTVVAVFTEGLEIKAVVMQSDGHRLVQDVVNVLVLVDDLLGQIPFVKVVKYYKNNLITGSII